MSRIARGRCGRTWVEVLVAVAIACLIVALLVPALGSATERAWAARCQGHLGELFRALSLYLHPDHGDHKMPASAPDGPAWFEKLEPFVAGYRVGQARDRFACPKAPTAQRGFTRDSLSFGWNEWDFPLGSVASQTATPREALVLGDSLGSAEGLAAPRADTVLTAGGELRLDARHGGEGHSLFLDGHVAGYERPQAADQWPDCALAPPRPPGETATLLRVLRWWEWVLVAACAAVPWAAVTFGVPYLAALRAERAEQRKEQAEAEERQATIDEERARKAARKEYLRRVPCGPVQAVELPRATLHVGRRSFQVRPDRELLIGRGKDADVRIVNRHAVSRQHAKIRPEARGYVLYDLYSRAGTFVAGEQVESKLLAGRARIVLGTDVELTFELQDA